MSSNSSQNSEDQFQFSKRKNGKIVFDYNHRKRKAVSPQLSGSDTDDENLILDKRPVADDFDDDIQIIEIIEASRPRPPPFKKIAPPPPPSLSLILKKEREEQEVEEKRLKFKQFVSERFPKKKTSLAPPPPVLSSYLEKERAQEEKLLKFKRFLSQKFPNRNKLSPDEEERLKNLDPNRMYLAQFEKYHETFNESYKVMDEPRNESDGQSTSSTSKESVDNEDEVSNVDNIKFVPNPRFNSKNNNKNPSLSNFTSTTATLSTAVKRSETDDQYKEDYDFLLNGIPNDLQYRISEYSKFKSNLRLLANQNQYEGFLFLKDPLKLKEKQGESERDNRTTIVNKFSRSSRYFGLSLAHIDNKDKDSALPLPTSDNTPSNKKNLPIRMSKDKFFDSGNNENPRRLAKSVRRRSSSPSILDTSAQTIDRFKQPIKNPTYTMPVFNNRPSTSSPSLLSSPVEENDKECQAADDTISPPPRDDFENIFLQIPLIRMPTPTPSPTSTASVEVDPSLSPDKFDFENDFDIYKQKEKSDSDLESDVVNITINPNPFERITFKPPTPDANNSNSDISLSEEIEIKVNPFDFTSESSLETHSSGTLDSESDSCSDESFVCQIKVRSDIFEIEETLSNCSFEVDEDRNQNIEIEQLTSPLSAGNEKNLSTYEQPVSLSMIDPIKIIPTSEKNAEFALRLGNNPETLQTIQNLLNGSRVVFQELNVSTLSNDSFQFLGGVGVLNLNEKAFSNVDDSN